MDAITGDNLDLILSMLDQEELLDHVFDEEIAESVKEVSKFA